MCCLNGNKATLTGVDHTSYGSTNNHDMAVTKHIVGSVCFYFGHYRHVYSKKIIHPEMKNNILNLLSSFKIIFHTNVLRTKPGTDFNISLFRKSYRACHCNCVPCSLVGIRLNTLSPRQDGLHFPDGIFNCIFLNENFWISIKFSLKFVPNGPINNIPALVQIMAWRRPGDKPLSEPMMVSLSTHICVTQPQWGNLKTMNDLWGKKSTVYMSRKLG